MAESRARRGKLEIVRRGLCFGVDRKKGDSDYDDDDYDDDKNVECHKAVSVNKCA